MDERIEEENELIDEYGEEVDPNAALLMLVELGPT